MRALFQHLTPGYQKAVVEKWRPVLEARDDIKNEHVKVATALVLENTQREFERKNINEAFTGNTGAFGAQSSTGDGGGAFGTYSNGSVGGTGTKTGTTWNYGNYGDYGSGNDARMPGIIIPTVRRIFPDLIAHETVGVQPMNGPIGFAFAIRAKYGVNGKGLSSGVPVGTEIGYNTIDSQFTGASGAASGLLSNSYYQAFAGSGYSGLGVNVYNNNGMGATLEDSEWWGIGDDMPQATFGLLKAAVAAKARKLGAQWSLELEEDMMNMNGIDVDAEMVNILSYEIQSEIDRQLLGEMVRAAIEGSRYSSWSPVSADGSNQLERIGTLYTHVLDKSNQIAITTRRGAANFAIVSPKVCALIERLSNFTLDSAGVVVDTNVAVSKVGTLRNGRMNLYRDTFAGGDYILLGFKGTNPYDAGIIYCPYIPVQTMRAVGQENWSPRLGVRTRYGIMNHIYGSANYYHFIKISDLTNTLLAGNDGTIGGRVFTQ